MTPAERIAVALERIADHICKSAPPAPLTAEEVAQRLGVSSDKVYQLARTKNLRSIKIGRSIRFKATDVEAYKDRRAA
jgi:excisionase family DNA binding protein